jgi:hypothetical protein
VIGGQDNYVYIRVWNRGTDATNATAIVYWSPPSTLVSPNLWNFIGSSTFADVPPGNLVQVSSPGIIWPSAGIPGPGHYCFLATVGNATDPAPNPGTFYAFDDFVNYIYSQNNISWRNFNVVAMGVHEVGGGFNEFLPLPFFITGTWDKTYNFVFETLAELPQASRMALQVPHWLARGLQPPNSTLEEHENADADPDERRCVRIPLHPRGRQQLSQIELRAAIKVPSQLLVHVPECPSGK